MQSRFRFALMPIVLALWSSVGLAQTSPNAAGHWEGSILMPDQEVSMTLDLGQSSTGAWIGSISFPRSTAIDVPLSNLSVAETAVRFKLIGIEGDPSFLGNLSADADRLSGTASNAKGAVPFQLKRNGEAKVKVPRPSSTLSKEFEGTWDGALNLGGKLMRIVLNLSPAGDGTATGTMVSVDDGNKSIPITSVTVSDKELQLDLLVISGTYHGTLGANGEIAGEWKQGERALPLTFKRAQ